MRHRTKRVAQRYNQTADFYEERYQKIQYSKYSLIKSALNLEIPSLYIDVGSGTGLFRKFLSRYNNPKIIGIDISLNMLMIAKARSIKERDQIPDNILADGDFPPFRSSTFNYIISFTHLQNTPTPKTTLKVLKRLCKPNGIIIASILKKNLTPEEFKQWFVDIELNPVKLISKRSVEDLIVIASNY